MRSNDDDLNRDPQQTLPPGASDARRIEVNQRTNFGAPETRGRRLKLGTPTRNPAPAVPSTHAPEVSAAVQRGFTLGPEARINVPGANQSKSAVQPWILVVAGIAVLSLVAALLLRPGASRAESLANQRLMTQYSKYLESKGSSGIDVAARKKDVDARLKAVTWAKAVGDRAELESELTALMFLDDDKSSPLYQYSVAQLKQLGPTKKGAGF